MKYDTRPTMRVQCGSLNWRGKADNADHAIIAALSKSLPKSPTWLLRVHNGLIWQYVNFKEALKIAGYSVKQSKRGFYVE